MKHPRWNTRLTGAFLVAVAQVWSCGGSSTSEIGNPTGGGAGTAGNATGATGGGTTTGASTGSGATTGGTAGSGSTGATAGATTGSGGTTGAGGATGAGGTATPGTGAGGTMTAACMTQTNVTLAVHVVLDVTWTGDNVKTKPGMGKVHIWNKSKLAVNGTMLSGDETQPCATLLPEFELGTIGGVLVGGTKVLIEIPNTVWDAPTMPKFHSQGTLNSWTVGGQADLDPTVALVGVKMADPMGAWPSTTDIASMMLAQDADGDGKPGFTATPKNGPSPYTQPPLSGIGIGPKADKIYLATRTIIALHGTLTSCEDMSGTAMVPFFDNHVVGCHVAGGAECDATQAAFVDSSRTIYVPSNATFTAKKVADGASCADVRAALPM